MLQTRHVIAIDLGIAGIKSFKLISSSVTIIGLCSISGLLLYGTRACPAGGLYPGITGRHSLGEALGDGLGDGYFLGGTGEHRGEWDVVPALYIICIAIVKSHSCPLAPNHLVATFVLTGLG